MSEMVILRDEKDFLVLCDIDDEKSRAMANGLVDVLSRYQIEEYPYGEPVGVDVDGYHLEIHYKRSH